MPVCSSYDGPSTHGGNLPSPTLIYYYVFHNSTSILYLVTGQLYKSISALIRPKSPGTIEKHSQVLREISASGAKRVRVLMKE